MAKATHVLKHELVTQVLAPLVVGGDLVPLDPIGAVRAKPLATPSNDSPLLEAQSTLTLARVRVARALAPIDVVEAVSPAEWVLAAAFNDLVQATHPDYRGLLRKRGPLKLLAAVEAILDLVPNVATIGDALSRHTLFSRIFEAARTDVRLKWWTGSATFLGTPPSKRLAMWPELRQVRETKTLRTIMDLANPETSAVPLPDFEQSVRALLRKTPLTDLATCDRPAPRFGWTHETLTFIAAQNGRMLALRALARRPSVAVDAVLGECSDEMLSGGPPVAREAVSALLRERALARAWQRMERGSAQASSVLTANIARRMGADFARTWVAENPGAIAPRTRALLLQALDEER